MSKILIIAEKPSLAREIKEMLSSEFAVKWSNQNGYYESQDYLLSNFFGHLLTMYKPDEYGFVEWNAEDLPIIPKPFILKYKGDTEKQGKLLKKLAAQSTLLVNACDPDREGEGIFRNWYEFEKVTLPVKRLWATSLALKDLRKSWEKVVDGNHYDNLAHAQKMRAQADWLVGMNASRAYGIAAKQKMAIGRVKTPTLSLVVKRDYEVENYTESYTYSLCGVWSDIGVTYIDGKEVKFEEKDRIEIIKKECDGKTFTLKSFNKERKTQNPPKPFSMPELQKEANRVFGFSLDKTLSLTQELYEKKIVSYPRTDSQYLPPADTDKYYETIEKFISSEQRKLLVEKGCNVPCVKNTESAHTGIIPTGENPQGMSEDETKLFFLVKERFITAFLEPKIYDQTTVFISNGVYDFRGICNKTISKGYTALVNEKTDEKENDEEQEQELNIEINENVLKQKTEAIKNLHVVNKKKAKPQFYTPATLLSAMMNIGKTLTNSEDREVLKDVDGIGTPATRDKIPVELIANGYIEQSGKYLRSTIKGKELIRWISASLKSAELTAHWEQKLRLIESGKYDYKQFKQEISDFVKEIVVINTADAKLFNDQLDAEKRPCPKCNKPLTENNAGYFCQKECGWALYKVMSGKKLSSKDLSLLFDKRTTGLIDGFLKKGSKEKFSAYVTMEAPEFNPRMKFNIEIDEACPLCNGKLQKSANRISCSNTTCGLTIWRSMCEKNLSEKNINDLIKKGRTEIIKGFVSAKSGKKFDATLEIDKEQKKVVFKFNK